MDNPDARKLQKTPVLVLDGSAVFFGLLMGLLAFRVAIGIGAMVDGSALPVLNLTNLTTVLLGASIMLYVGAMDDILGLTPRARLLIEVLVMLGVIYGLGMCVLKYQQTFIENHGVPAVYYAKSKITVHNLPDSAKRHPQGNVGWINYWRAFSGDARDFVKCSCCGRCIVRDVVSIVTLRVDTLW